MLFGVRGCQTPSFEGTLSPWWIWKSFQISCTNGMQGHCWWWWPVILVGYLQFVCFVGDMLSADFLMHHLKGIISNYKKFLTLRSLLYFFPFWLHSSYFFVCYLLLNICCWMQVHLKLTQVIICCNVLSLVYFIFFYFCNLYSLLCYYYALMLCSFCNQIWHYLLDLLRVIPRDANYTGPSSRFCILRPKLITAYCRVSTPCC